TVESLPPAITTDIICGFPTETQEDFEETIKIASQSKYLHMHIFPYSIRTGTAAARWNQLSPEVVQERVRRLLELDHELSLAYRQQLLHRSVKVLLEQQSEEEGQMKGRCDHYAEISLQTNAQIGAIVEAKVTQVQSGKTVAQPTLQIL
ncbi:hypothetical protein H8D99_01160, partial [bacterium]|nr:hypothetical protein [bacterium]